MLRIKAPENCEIRFEDAPVGSLRNPWANRSEVEKPNNVHLIFPSVTDALIFVTKLPKPWENPTPEHPYYTFQFEGNGRWYSALFLIEYHECRVTLTMAYKSHWVRLEKS